MFSQTVEYALRAMSVLACHHDTPMTVQDISDAARVPKPYLSKMMQSLARVNLVGSRRGLGGGFALSRSPEEITMWDIVVATDPLKQINICPIGKEDQGEACSLHRHLNQAVLAIEELLRRTTLRDVVEQCRDNGGGNC